MMSTSGARTCQPSGRPGHSKATRRFPEKSASRSAARRLRTARWPQGPHLGAVLYRSHGLMLCRSLRGLCRVFGTYGSYRSCGPPPGRPVLPDQAGAGGQPGLRGTVDSRWVMPAMHRSLTPCSSRSWPHRRGPRPGPPPHRPGRRHTGRADANRDLGCGKRHAGRSLNSGGEPENRQRINSHHVVLPSGAATRRLRNRPCAMSTEVRR